MKKALVVFCCAVFMMMLLVGCGCDHEYTSTVTKKPTYAEEGEETFVCSICGDTYIEKMTRHLVSPNVLDRVLSDAKYYSGPFSISIGRLVNSSMDNYEIEYMTGEEAIEKGHLKKNDLDSSINIDYVYFAIISGDTMVNPDIPYMTEYEKEAVKVWMLFDENDEPQLCGVALCENLQTCAILIMTSSY